MFFPSKLLLFLVFDYLNSLVTRPASSRIVRHPQLTGVSIWAFAHLMMNGDSRSIVLFGTMFIWAILSIAALINRRDGEWVKQPVPGLGKGDQGPGDQRCGIRGRRGNPPVHHGYGDLLGFIAEPTTGPGARSRDLAPPTYCSIPAGSGDTPVLSLIGLQYPVRLFEPRVMACLFDQNEVRILVVIQ